MSEEKVCHCCGQTLPPPMPVGLRLRGLEGELVARVYRAGKHGIRADHLFSYLYASDHNGGPMYGVKIIHVRVNHVNKKLAAVGKKISAPRGGGKDGYREYTLRDIDCPSVIST